MGLLKFFSRQRIITAIVIYAVVAATWGAKWYVVEWGGVTASGVQTPLYAMLTQYAPPWLLMGLTLLLYALIAAVIQSIFSRIHPNHSKNYLMHLFVPLLSTIAIAGNEYGNIAGAIGTLVGLYVVILLLTREERGYSDTLFRPSFVVGLATLIYYPVALLLLLVVVAMLYRNAILAGKKLLIIILAFLIPGCFAAGIALFNGENVDRYVGMSNLVSSIRHEWPLSGVKYGPALICWGVLLLTLPLLSINSGSRQSRTNLAVYGDLLLRLLVFLSIIGFILLPSSSAVPIMIAPAIGSGYVYYFTGRGRAKGRDWLFTLILGLIILGNVWNAI